jgi:hypothetical protein
MKLIPLSRGLFAKVDDRDFDYLNQFKWYAKYNKSTNSYYAYRHNKDGFKKYSKIKMHREIMKVTDPKIFVDHKNHDTLNNCRYNLRKCSRSQNQGNRGACKNNTSGYKGVSWHKTANKWVVYIYYDGKQHNLGLYIDKHEAARVYNNKAKEVWGKFAQLNKITQNC